MLNLGAKLVILTRISYLRAMKFALITGASSGIGAEYAHQLARKGHNVIIVSNQRDANEAIASELASQYGVTAVPMYADLSTADAAEQIYATCKEMDAEVDILVSNAGVLHFGRFVNTTDEYLDFITALHCTTPMKLCRRFAMDMCARGKGHILIMSSLTAWTPFPTMSLYGSTKVALKSFAQSLWYELRPYGVSVTTIFPGAVDTPLYNLSQSKRHLFRSLGVMMSAERLARCGLRAMFGGRRTCIPGLFSKIAVFACYLLPAHALLPVMKIPAIRRILERI